MYEQTYHFLCFELLLNYCCIYHHGGTKIWMMLCSAAHTATTWQRSARFCSPQCLMSSHFANKLLTCKCLILSPATCGNAWCSRAGGAARFWVGTGCENWMNKILYPSLRYCSLKSHQTSLQQACSPKGQPSYTKWTGTSQLPILLLDSFDFIKNANVCFWTIVVRLSHTTESQNCGCWFRFSNYTDRSKLTTWLVWVFWCDSLILFHESQCVLGTLTLENHFVHMQLLCTRLLGLILQNIWLNQMWTQLRSPSAVSQLVSCLHYRALS